MRTPNSPDIRDRTLARDARCDLEKEQSLRLVRVLIEHTGPRLLEARDTMPMSVLRAVIAVADAPEEKLRLAALELLGELSETSHPVRDDTAEVAGQAERNLASCSRPQPAAFGRQRWSPQRSRSTVGKST